MNLFESLQILQESYEPTVTDMFDSIASAIQERFGCEIDDMSYDEKSYPKKFRAQLAIYNISYETCEEIKEEIKRKLFHYKNVSVNVHSTDKYFMDEKETLSVFRIRAYNE